ncbi:hypothetical protein HS088_TW15G00004 [Tripterygium wilfordii]|uniref:Uncharacterized protein n=1 Tax=Tripterygium wilfordii TaxID=458696 RepID=A0A7J7CKB8_TRIWF|nr:hypothetical protein HS088_TW15G00004 [Tripterygium wilfordii]
MLLLSRFCGMALDPSRFGAIERDTVQRKVSEQMNQFMTTTKPNSILLLENSFKYNDCHKYTVDHIENAPSHCDTMFPSFGKGHYEKPLNLPIDKSFTPNSSTTNSALHHSFCSLTPSKKEARF